MSLLLFFPAEDLHPIAEAVAKDKQMPRQRVLLEHVAGQGSEPIER